jgi:DNA polymerase-3 subunit beta
METRMITTIEVNEVEGEGVFAIPSKNLLEALKELPEQPIRFEINDENLELFIYYENGKYNFIAQKGDEYPRAKPLSDNASQLALKASDLLAGISRTLFAGGEDELRPVINGVFFDIGEENITFVASDGFKLVRFKNFGVNGNPEASLILPKKPANLLKVILPREDGKVIIGFDTNIAYFEMTHFTVVCRLIEGRYPKYNSVIPQDNPYRLTIDRVLFLNALKRVSVFSNPGTNLIKLFISPDNIFISAQDIDFSTSAEETIACLYDGVAMNIGFKGSSLIEILNNIPSEEIALVFADPSRAALVIPVENEENEDLLMLLIPMMI